MTVRALCLCNGGHVRSVTLARLLNKRSIETLVGGVDRDYSNDTIRLLVEWADVIYIQADSLQKFKRRFLPVGAEALRFSRAWESRAMAKMDTRFDVGPDDWKVPQHPDLLRRLRDLVEADASL